MRICVDLSKLNESVKREKLVLPSVELSCKELVFSASSMRIVVFGRYRCQRSLPYSRRLQRHLGDFATTDCYLV